MSQRLYELFFLLKIKFIFRKKKKKPARATGLGESRKPDLF
jgi:hypothetical protein